MCSTSQLSLPFIKKSLASAFTEVRIVEEIGSTNRQLCCEAKKSQPSGLVVLIAHRQTAGKGTRERVWVTPKEALLFSMSLPLLEEMDNLSAIPLVIGVSLVDTLRSQGIFAQLKWPNDIWIAGGKAAGILCEVIKDVNGKKTLVIGIGINLVVDEVMQTTHGWPITSLKDAGWCESNEYSRASLLCTILNGIQKELLKVRQAGTRQTLLKFERFDIFHGRTVAITNEFNQKCIGLNQGVDENGRLKLLMNDELVYISSGVLNAQD